MIAIPFTTPRFPWPFAVADPNMYIRGPRYRLEFDRIILPRFNMTPEQNAAFWQRQHEAVESLRS